MTSTKRNAHTLSLEDAFFDKPQERESNWPSPIPQLLYVLRLVETFWLVETFVSVCLNFNFNIQCTSKWN